MLAPVTQSIFAIIALYLCCTPILLVQSVLTSHSDEGYQASTSADERLSVLDMLPGTAKPELQSELAASTEGVLVECLVAPGDRVVKGELLARLDDRVAKASLGLAQSEAVGKSEVAIAEERLLQARNYFYRVQKAYRQKAASTAEFDKARGAVNELALALETAKEERRSAEAKVKIELAKVAAHEIRAPFSGTVIRVDARVGERTSTTKGLIVVANFERLHVELYVPTDHVNALQVGRTYTLFADAPVDRCLEAQLIFKEPAIDPATSTVRCRFLIDNSNESLSSGFTSRLCDPTIRTGEHDP